MIIQLILFLAPYNYTANIFSIWAVVNKLIYDGLNLDRCK
jgi:hypothetical protein